MPGQQMGAEDGGQLKIADVFLLTIKCKECTEW